MPLFDNLERASFAGYAFPVSDVEVTGGLRDHVHEYPHSPGGAPEKLGRKLYEFSFTSPMLAGFPRYPKLWPETAASLRIVFEGGAVLDASGRDPVSRPCTGDWVVLRSWPDGPITVEAVLPDGSIYAALTPLKKDNRGFDLKQLFIGAEGTLGIVTGATLKLVPAVADRVVAWVGLPSIHAARGLLLHCEAAAGNLLEGFEVMPRACLDAVLDYLPDARNPLGQPHEWHALIELAGDAETAVSLRDQAERLLAAAFEQGLAEDAVLSANEAQAEAFWTLRDSVSPAERAKGPAMQHDISVPVAAMADFVATAAPAIENEFPGTQALGFGHLGDGNIHFHVLAPQGVVRGEWEEGQGKEISARVHDLVTAAQGSISAEHGIGQMKRDELARLGDPVALALLKQIKAALDPKGLMNPGKLLALDPRTA